MPTNMSMQDLIAPALEAGSSVTNQGMAIGKNLSDAAQTHTVIKATQQKSANDMAQSLADLETKKAKQQEMQQQLIDTKYESLTKRIQQQQNIQNPNTRKRVAEANDKVGLAHDGFFMDLHNDYKEDPQKNAALAKYLSGGKPSQEDMQNILSMVQDPTAAHQGFELIKNKLQGDALAAAATIKGKAMVDAAGKRVAPGSPQAVRAQNTITTNYEKAVKPFESTLNAVDQLKEVLSKVDSGELSDAKNVKAEIEAKIASVFGGGKPSTVFGQQAVGMDSYYGHMMSGINKALGTAKGVLTEDQKKQLHQEVNVFGANAAKQHEDAFLTHQELVPDVYQPAIEQSYARYRMQKSLPSHIQYNGAAIPVSGTGKTPQQMPGQAPAAPAMTLEDRAKKGSINLEAARKKMTDEQIDAALKQKGL